MATSDEPSEAELQESIRDWSLTKWYAWATIVSGTVLAGICTALLATDTSPGVATVLVVLSVLLVGLAVLGLRRIKRIEDDPSVRNPRDNAVARGLFRFEKRHPVLAGIVAFVLLAGAVWLKLR